MDAKNIVEIAGGLAGLVSTSLEIQRRVSDYRLDARENQLRARAGELAKFLQIQTQLQSGGADEQLTQQAISSTKTELDEVLKELVRVQQKAGAMKVDEISAIRRWLLLFVPTRRLGWVLHFGFYFSVFFLGLSIFEIKEVLASKLLPSTLVLYSEIFTAIMAAVLLRYWALMEKRWAEGYQPTPSPWSQRLLWYRPASRRELMARAALVFGFGQFAFFFQSSWISLFKELFSFIQLSVTVIVFYAWSIAELSLATHPVAIKFPHNLRFLRLPQNLTAWFWTICFYFIVGCAIFFVRQIATVDVLPAQYKKADFLLIGARIGLIIRFMLAYLLPMYALHRIVLNENQPGRE